MDTDPLLNLENKNYMYVPDEYLDASRHKHRKPGNWSKFYFYKNRTKTDISPDDIKCDYEVTSSLEYQQDIFYKLSHLSDNDSTFDYFYKLKTDIPNIMFKQNNRYKTPQSSKKRTNKARTAHWKNNPTQVFNVNKDGKIEVTF